jgi:hypothetical protein
MVNVLFVELLNRGEESLVEVVQLMFFMLTMTIKLKKFVDCFVMYVIELWDMLVKILEY